MANRYGLQIRAALPSDAPDLATLLGAAGRSVAPADLERRLESLRGGGGATLLAIEWGPPSGVVALNWCPTLDGTAPVALVTTLLVAPDDRRRGIGRLLLKAGAQAARGAGCDVLHLAVPDGAGSLRGFGEATGFVRAAETWTRPLRKRPDGGRP